VFSSQLVIGLAIVVVGVLFTLDNLDVLDARYYLPFWPVVLLAIGISNLMMARDSGARTMGAFLTFLGAWLLSSHFGLLFFRFRDLWPILLMFWGGMIVWRGLHGGGPVRPRAFGDSNHAIGIIALMSGFDRVVTADPFEGGDLSAIMGGGKLDLTRAKVPAGGSAVVNVFALMGGVEIRIPDDWAVENKVLYFMGGSNDRSRVPGNPSAPRLVLKGFVMMGGVEIKN
jgi:predicted membrane protein